MKLRERIIDILEDIGYFLMDHFFLILSALAFIIAVAGLIFNLTRLLNG